MAVTRHNVIIASKINLAGNFWKIDLQFAEPFSFKAGQYLSVKVAGDGTRRSYSIASAPDETPVSLLVDVTPMGLGSKLFLTVKEGDGVEVMGPMGVFTVGENSNKKLMIATGSGIVPFRPMIIDLLKNRKYTGDLRLIWGMRFEKDLFWQEEFNKLAQEYPNFSWDLILSKPDEHWHGKQGHVGDCLEQDIKGGKVNLAEWETYLCGNQRMIVETAASLETFGMARSDIHFEKFY